MGNALQFNIFHDSENLNIAECYVTDRFFLIVAETQKMPKCNPPFSHRPKNESCQNQKRNMSNEISY